MYAKVFASLYQGTLRGRADEILVFTNLLAHADRYGIVDKHWRAIAEETGLSEAEVKAAIEVLERPDPESRTPDEEGRRIIRLDGHRAWGWQVVNYGKYRAIRSEDDRREQNRIAQEKWRNENKQSKPASAESKPDKPPSAHAEGEAEGEAKEKMERARGLNNSTNTQHTQPIVDVKEEEKQARRRASQMPSGFSPNASHQALAKKHGIDLIREFEKFSSWHGSKGSTFKDWDKALVTWILKASEYARPQGQPPDVMTKSVRDLSL